jgi:hypothetical protein
MVISRGQGCVCGSRFGGDHDMLGDLSAVPGASSEFLGDVY